MPEAGAAGAAGRPAAGAAGESAGAAVADGLAPGRPLCVLIPGMHRSGTSLLARATVLCGATAPATALPPGPDNPDGFFESAPLVAASDALLADGGSAWAEWRHVAVAPEIGPARFGALLDREFGTASLFVWKDPRLALLLPAAEAALAAGGRARAVLLPVRHPGAVARSLAARNGFPPAFSVLLWLRHVLAAERATRGAPRAIVAFDALVADWRGTLAAAGRRAGIAWPVPPGSVVAGSVAAGPVAGGPVRPRRPDGEAPADAGSAYAAVWCRHAWEALSVLARGEAGPGGAGEGGAGQGGAGEGQAARAEAAWAVLDRVRDQFDDASRLFGGVARAPAPAAPPRAAHPPSGAVPAPAGAAPAPRATAPALAGAAPAPVGVAPASVGVGHAPGEAAPAPATAAPASAGVAPASVGAGHAPVAVAAAPARAAPASAGVPAASVGAVAPVPRAAPGSRSGRDLRAVTLVAADTIAPVLAARALARSASGLDVGDAVLFTDRPVPAAGVRLAAIEPLHGIERYGRFMLGGLAARVATSHALVVQWDGFAVAPEAWDPDFLAWDYIGARWPGVPDAVAIGNGGFSLRSRRLLDALATDRRFDARPEIAEDTLIGRAFRPLLERDHGIRFAPRAVADRFSYEGILPHGPTFGFHGVFNLWRHLDDAALIAMATHLTDWHRAGRGFAQLVATLHRADRAGAVAALLAAPALPDGFRTHLAAVLGAAGARDCLAAVGRD